MKRICTESEWKVLRKNWKNISDDFCLKSINSKVGDIFCVIFLWCLILTAIIELWTGSFGKWFLFFSAMITYVVAQGLAKFILDTIRARRIKKRFLKKRDFLLNGATVISVKDDTLLKVRYTFIEDDEYLSNGEPYGITVTSFKCDIKDLKVGERLLLIYENDGKYGASGDVSLQIMRMTPKIVDMMKEADSVEKNRLDVKELTCFPHPNAAKIEKEVHALEELEKKEVGQWFVKAEKKAARNMVLGFGAVFFFCLNNFMIILSASGKFEYDSQKMSLVLYIIASLVIVIILTYLWRILNKRIKITPEIWYVQEILFKGVTVKSKGQISPVFYEWNDKRLTEKEYPYASKGKVYGQVFRKYLDENKNIVRIVPKSKYDIELTKMKRV